MFHCHQVIGAKQLLRFPNIDFEWFWEGCKLCKHVLKKQFFGFQKIVFFRKARFHSTKGLLTQRNEKKNKQQFLGTWKIVFCQVHLTIGFPETEGICNFGPRFHKGKCKKTHFELGHGIPFPATGIAKKIIFQSLKNCFRTRRSCNVSQGQCNKKQFFRSRKIVLSQSSMSFHQGPVNTEKRQKKQF